ncbi:hypothetical protein MRX96_034451 [Rhipicephalus microplus]
MKSQFLARHQERSPEGRQRLAEGSHRLLGNDMVNLEGRVAALGRCRTKEIEPLLRRAANNAATAHERHEFDTEHNTAHILARVVDAVRVIGPQSVHHFSDVGAGASLGRGVDRQELRLLRGTRHTAHQVLEVEHAGGALGHAESRGLLELAGEILHLGHFAAHGAVDLHLGGQLWANVGEEPPRRIVGYGRGFLPHRARNSLVRVFVVGAVATEDAVRRRPQDEQQEKRAQRRSIHDARLVGSVASAGTSFAHWYRGCPERRPLSRLRRLFSAG